MDPSGCLGVGLVDEDHYKIDNHKLNRCVYREQMKEKRELEQEPDNLPPAFDLKPEPIQVEEGETAKFMAKVSGHPRPRLTWWVNGSMIIAVSTTFYIQKGLELSDGSIEVMGIIIASKLPLFVSYSWPIVVISMKKI